MQTGYITVILCLATVSRLLIDCSSNVHIWSDNCLANIINTIDIHWSIADQGTCCKEKRSKNILQILTNNYTYKNILQLFVNVYIKFVIVYECLNNVPWLFPSAKLKVHIMYGKCLLLANVCRMLYANKNCPQNCVCSLILMHSFCIHECS